MDFEHLKQVTLAKAVGVSRNTILQWTKAGMPRNDDKSYSLPECITWLIEQAKSAQQPASTSPEADRWLTEYRKERALKAKIERKKLEGELMTKQEVFEGWAWRVKEVTAALSALPERLPPMLEGKERSGMREIIAEEVWKLRDAFARG